MDKEKADFKIALVNSQAEPALVPPSPILLDPSLGINLEDPTQLNFRNKRAPRAGAGTTRGAVGAARSAFRSPAA